jgi:hypothetical protein
VTKELVEMLKQHRVRILAMCTSLLLAAVYIVPAIAVACEGGELKFIPTKGQVSLKTFFEDEVEYTGVGETEALKVLYAGGFEDNGSSCKGKSLKNGEKCTVKTKCPTLAHGTKGKVTVESPLAGILRAEQVLECVA